MLLSVESVWLALLMLTQLAFMGPELFQLVGEIWLNQPTITILLVAGLIVFSLSLIDTHLYRKSIESKRQQLRHQ